MSPVAGLGGSLLLVAALPEGQCLATGVAGCSRWGTGKGLGVHSQRLWQELHLHLRPLHLARVLPVPVLCLRPGFALVPGFAGVPGFPPGQALASEVALLALNLGPVLHLLLILRLMSGLASGAGFCI